MLKGEELPRASETRLDFVRDEQRVVLLGELSQPLQVPCGRDDDAALALNGLDQNGDRALVYRCCDRVGVPERQ